MPPPTSLDEEVARRLYEQLNAQKVRSGRPASWHAPPRCATPAPLPAEALRARAPAQAHTPAAGPAAGRSAEARPLAAQTPQSTPQSSGQTPQSGEDPRASR